MKLDYTEHTQIAQYTIIIKAAHILRGECSYSSSVNLCANFGLLNEFHARRIEIYSQLIGTPTHSHIIIPIAQRSHPKYKHALDYCFREML